MAHPQDEKKSDVVRVSAPLLMWAGAEPGTSIPRQGGFPLVHISVMEPDDGQVKSFVLSQKDGKVAIKDLVAALAQQGDIWASKLLERIKEI